MVFNVNYLTELANGGVSIPLC